MVSKSLQNFQICQIIVSVLSVADYSVNVLKGIFTSVKCFLICEEISLHLIRSTRQFSEKGFPASLLEALTKVASIEVSIVLYVSFLPCLFAGWKSICNRLTSKSQSVHMSSDIKRLRVPPWLKTLLIT